MNKKAPLRWLFAVAGAILIASVGLGLTIAVWKNPLRGTTLIEVLRLFLSFVILSLGMVFGVTFRREISQFLKLKIVCYRPEGF